MPKVMLSNGQEVAFDVSGNGPPLLLLHGFPQCRAMWHGISPRLESSFTTVRMDLRGYGESRCDIGRAAMTFRRMAEDPVLLMAHLGFSRFHLVGHDRGARVSHRLALDHPACVASMALLDIVPTHLLVQELRADVARAYYHWFFLAQGGGLPERMIAADPDAFYHSCLGGWGGAGLEAFDPAALEIYRQHWRDPAIQASMNADYRAALDFDVADDHEDLSRTVAAPTLVLYGAQGIMAEAYDVGATWRDRLADMQVQAIPGGHFFPDIHPQETADALEAFLAAQPAIG